ncbi:MAG: 16S rRNA processing protein RimM [Rubellimicrobium sp.]|nr:16S rRNA processing protein RimM [Rubellimicrobium sp.]
MGGREIVVGQIAGAFGVRGEVRVKSYCAEPADIAIYTPLRADGGQVFPVLVVTGQAPGALVARIEGISTKEEADALKGARLWADRARLPAPGDEEYYHADLIGLEVVDPGGAVLGRVKAVPDYGAGDLIEIARPGSDSLLVPFTRAFVPVVDIAAGRMVVDAPEDEA